MLLQNFNTLFSLAQDYYYCFFSSFIYTLICPSFCSYLLSSSQTPLPLALSCAACYRCSAVDCFCPLGVSTCLILHSDIQLCVNQSYLLLSACYVCVEILLLLIWSLLFIILLPPLFFPLPHYHSSCQLQHNVSCFHAHTSLSIKLL